MKRRDFLATSLLGATALTKVARGQAAASPAREYYQLRKYKLVSGPQTALAEAYFADALIPALRRLGMGPVGAFRLDIGPETPTYYLLIPGSPVEELVNVDFALAQDEAFMKIAQPFWSAPATAPPFERIESTLLAAFAGWPKVTPPAKGKRIFQMRSYESPSQRDHLLKVEMFHKAEFEIFKQVGFRPVFFGDALVGPRLPNLTYMLSFTDMNELNTLWDGFKTNPEWKRLSTSSRYGFEAILNNVSNLILSPLSMSQI
ncbi:NIPSNAP protein [Granulicella rosea]|uniref:NIPSNAP protein n=1 Tax=Granulicella rosea TaxID=474952 RepID=A0A239LYD2_9BACT|nr:NIPSNAP family protein [Granulicella rosea]SNT35280.1 NIPSNAP protein [Granulicella rosea]